MVKFYTVFVLFIVIALGVLLLVNAGYYPVAMVDGQVISARQFYKNYSAASVSLDSVREAYRSIPWKEKVEPLEIQAYVLEQLIENTLVHNEAKRELGDSFEAILQEKIDEVKDIAGLGEATEKMFGFNLEEFRKELLAPLAEREMLTGRLFLEGTSLADWLREKKKSVGVRIFSGKLYWTGEKVEVRK